MRKHIKGLSPHTPRVGRDRNILISRCDHARYIGADFIIHGIILNISE